MNSSPVNSSHRTGLVWEGTCPFKEKPLEPITKGLSVIDENASMLPLLETFYCIVIGRNSSVNVSHVCEMDVVYKHPCDN